MDVFVLPAEIRVSPHAAARYLTRVLKKPVTPRRIHTARVLTNINIHDKKTQNDLYIKKWPVVSSKGSLVI